MRYLAVTTSMVIAVTSQASVQFYNSDAFAGNVATRTAWLTDLGIAGGDTFVDFEGVAAGTNLNNADLGGGASISHPSGNAVVQSSSSFFGSSNPIDTKALALAEIGGVITLSFSSAVTYVGGYDIDKATSFLTVTLSDNSEFTFSHDATGSSGNSAEFWGVRSLTPTLGIIKVEFEATSGGDGEWGLDNLEYGGEPVPEPATMAVLALGLGAIAKRRKRA